MTGCTRSVWATVAVAGALAMPALFGASSAQATPKPDNSWIVNVDIENDAVAGTDRYYTAGQRVSVVMPSDLTPKWASRVGRALWGDGMQRIAVGIDQSIFTPSNTQVTNPDPHDRPYAATLTANFNLIQDKDNNRSILGLALGVAGPSALGRQVQNGFHNLIGDTENKGWGYQIRDEPIIQFTSERTYRLPMYKFWGLETDALPSLTFGVGNLRVYGQTGVLFRIGQGLQSDFGPNRIRPGLTGGDAYTPTGRFAWYIFAGGDGQAVAHDMTLDGNTWRDSRHVSRQPFVGELEAGLAIIAYGMKVSYTHVVQTQEFHGQHGGLFQFGVFNLSTRF
ncbi:lipid A deacylase LpxR family protein [Granulibacter bethesdensis]|uniref:lipid A deacylase LpxR family protein n=1 Tax=Granulibacter bethesdensis TaxID=364410 RepID=UPI0003F1EDE0|nr:lipid A deacylase LpxR family protein [Granulibacter bethesdensis]AHJ66547.1 putative membrane spanning protein [Granulibacter bethesdensis CGDNIH4]